MLFLIKASRVREFRIQNVEILGAPEGVVITTAYKRRWIQKDVSPAVGDGCTIVFADSPYVRFDPVRYGTISAITEDDAGLTIDVRLGRFVCTDDALALTRSWEGRDHDRPGSDVFVLESADPGLTVHSGPEGLFAGWRSAVDRLAGNPYFAETTSIVPIAIRDARGAEVGPDDEVSAGSEVSVEVELRTCRPGSVGQVEIAVDVEPAWGIEPIAPIRCPSSGKVSIPITVLAEDGINISLRVLPNTLFSSRPALRLSTSPRAALTPPSALGTGSSLPDRRALPVREIVRLLEREASMPDRAWFELYDELIIPFAGADPQLVHAFIGWALRCEEWDVAYDQLVSIENRSPGDELDLLVASIRSHRRIDLECAMEGIDLNAQPSFERILGCVEHADPAVLGHLTRLLADDRLGADKAVRFLHAAFARLRDSGDLEVCVMGIAHHDLELASSVLVSRWSEPAEMPLNLLHILVCELQAVGQPLGPYLRRHAANALGAGDLQRALDDVKLARSIHDADERLRVLAGIGHDLIGSSDERAMSEGFGLICEAATLAAAGGNLDLAVELGRTAVGYALAAGPEHVAELDAAREITQRIAESLEQNPALGQWRQMRTETRYADVRGATRNLRLHLVGGTVAGWGEQLDEFLDLAELRWHETEKKRSANSDWASSLDGDRDLVVLLTDFLGHDIGDQVRERCRKRKVPCIKSSWGLESVLADLQSVLCAPPRSSDGAP